MITFNEPFSVNYREEFIKDFYSTPDPSYYTPCDDDDDDGWEAIEEQVRNEL